jgi:hypothetical protein
VGFDRYDMNFEEVSGDLFLSAPAEVDVLGGTSPVPEPSGAGFLVNSA